MARTREPRSGERLSVRGLKTAYSFWPTKKTTRWKLQRRLYVRDPWAMLFEAVYRSGQKRPQVDEALSYLDQAEDYFNAASRVERPNVKPVLLYYSILNLAKCLILINNPGLDMSRARHGLVAAPKKRAILGDEVSVKSSVKYVNIFNGLMQALEGGKTILFQTLQVRDLLPQILPGHRLWTYGSDKIERFLAVTKIDCYVNHKQHSMWLRLTFNHGEVKHIAPSVSAFIKRAHLPGQWHQVNTGQSSNIVLEQAQPFYYQQRPTDRVQELFQTLRPALWSTVTSSYPYRQYYVFVDSHLVKRRLPQWAAVYVLFFYLSDLTRYRPQHFDRFLESRYGPQIECILDECPRQFLYLMASELLKREVAPAGLA